MKICNTKHDYCCSGKSFKTDSFSGCLQFKIAYDSVKLNVEIQRFSGTFTLE